MNKQNVKVSSLSDTTDSSDDDNKRGNTAAAVSFYSPIKSSSSVSFNAVIKRERSDYSQDSDEEEKKTRFQSFPSVSYNAVKREPSDYSQDSDEEEKKPRMKSFPSVSYNAVKRERLDDSQDSDEEEKKKPRVKIPLQSFSSGSANSHKRKLPGDGHDNDSARHLPPKKKPLPRGLSIESKQKGNYNDVAKKMMEKMGFEEGKGLGKHGQGRTDIIETSKQRGRRGLGRQIQGLEPGDAGWDFEKDEVAIEEFPNWLPDCPNEPPTLDVLRKWSREGPKKRKIDDEVEFCDSEVLEQVLSCKSIFDELEPEEMRRARTRSNPYETIRGVMFLNRAAMKMANMDAVFDFMFTKPVDEAGKPLVEQNELLYFADVCAGPGGFSEYVLWRKGWEAKGFGFTLRGANDFKLEDFFSGHCESFEPHYGVNGISGDGDVFVSENQREFRRFVLQQTGGKGVHFMMADGGFSVEGQENIQEILSKQLYLCQFLMALYILRPGGHFVCKLFDIFTPFSVGLVYLMYRCFKKVCIHKPVTSRPANSERYIICKWRREEIKDVSDYFYEVNCRLNETSSVLSNEDILEIVPLDVLKDDVGFYNYIRESNNLLGKVQIQNLTKIRAFYQNTNLHEDRQSDTRKQCLEYWKIPDKVRSAPPRPDPQPRFEELIKDKSPTYLSYLATNLDHKVLSSIKGMHDYFCLVSAVKKGDRNERLFVLGLGRQNVFKWDGSSSYKWEKVDVVLEIPKETLLYGEFVNELQGEGKGQRKMRSLHIIDALVLGGKDIRDLPYQERMARIEVFIRAISKPSRPDHAPIRAKKVYRFADIGDIFNSMENHMVKGVGMCPRLCYSCTEDRFYIPQGILFLKVVNDPWMIGYSQKRNSHYYFHTKTHKSFYETPKLADANFRSSFEKRIFWSWDDEGAEAHLNGCLKDKDKVDKETILRKLEKLKANL